jgi:hypothetical protein
MHGQRIAVIESSESLRASAASVFSRPWKKLRQNADAQCLSGQFVFGNEIHHELSFAPGRRF